MVDSRATDEDAGRRYLWTTLACILAALILLTAWLPGRRVEWSHAAILMLLLALASEWLVLKRVYRYEHAEGRRRNAVKVIMSVLLVVSAIILAISSRQ